MVRVSAVVIPLFVAWAALAGCAVQASFQPFPESLNRKDAEAAFATIQQNEQALAQKIAELSQAKPAPVSAKEVAKGLQALSEKAVEVKGAK